MCVFVIFPYLASLDFCSYIKPPVYLFADFLLLPVDGIDWYLIVISLGIAASIFFPSILILPDKKENEPNFCKQDLELEISSAAILNISY